MAPSSAARLRIEAEPTHRRLATAAQVLVLLAIVGLAWAGARILGLLWPERGDPEVGRAVWLFGSLLSLSVLTLAWLIVLMQDLVKMVVEVGEDGVTVDRLIQPFSARWDEIREVGIVPARGHLTLRSARGTLTTTERLLGSAPFAELTAALRAHLSDTVHEWTPWQAVRRQLLLFVVPALGVAFVVALGQGLWRRRTAAFGRRR
jgi:TRAP-type C4-dicarboxylate transport system permease small subunit